MRTLSIQELHVVGGGSVWNAPQTLVEPSGRQQFRPAGSGAINPTTELRNAIANMAARLDCAGGDWTAIG